MPELALNVPEEFRRGGKKEQELASVESGRALIELMCSKAATMSEEDVGGMAAPDDFRDWFPERPLWRAVYSRENSIKLVENTGWTIDSLNDPEQNIQHYMICSLA